MEGGLRRGADIGLLLRFMIYSVSISLVAILLFWGDM